MTATTLEYLEQMDRLVGTAKVVALETEPDGKLGLILDRTIFYPQGGGQPSDRGLIAGRSFRFAVESVQFSDGTVHHIGVLQEGHPAPGDEASLHVDENRRDCNSRLQSG